MRLSRKMTVETENVDAAILRDCKSKLNRNPLNNPWLGANWCADIDDFQRSWELEGNRAILIDPITQNRLEAFQNENRAN